MSETVTKMSKPAAIGFVVSCVFLGIWMFGFTPHFWSRPFTQKDLECRDPNHPGGMPNAPRSLAEVQPYVQARGLTHVYSIPSVLVGGAIGGLLGLIGISLVNWSLRRKPILEDRNDSDQQTEGQVSSESASRADSPKPSS
jgi:hypothetical protein